MTTFLRQTTQASISTFAMSLVYSALGIPCGWPCWYAYKHLVALQVHHEGDAT
ncbi:hypothetical protein BD414DRAFT_483763 [Trametes punicea]|nr:hypothetical protein BD414DRAFT_483763 [Trametes punicea]